MESIRDPEVMRRMELAFDLYESGELIMRENLRRRYPDADGTEIERRLTRWLQKRPISDEAPPASPTG